MAANNSATNVHASGMPDTPVEVLTDLLSKAAKEENVEQLKLLVQRAHKLVAGLDPYLEECSTPPSDVSFFAALGRTLLMAHCQCNNPINRHLQLLGHKL